MYVAANSTYTWCAGTSPVHKRFSFATLLPICRSRRPKLANQGHVSHFQSQPQCFYRHREVPESPRPEQVPRSHQQMYDIALVHGLQLWGLVSASQATFRSNPVVTRISRGIQISRATQISRVTRTSRVTRISKGTRVRRVSGIRTEASPVVEQVRYTLAHQQL